MESTKHYFCAKLLSSLVHLLYKFFLSKQSIMKQGLKMAPSSSMGDEKNSDKHHVRGSSPVESATYFQSNAEANEARSELIGGCSRRKRRVNQRLKEFVT